MGPPEQKQTNKKNNQQPTNSSSSGSSNLWETSRERRCESYQQGLESRAALRIVPARATNTETWSPVFWMDLQSLMTLQLLRARRGMVPRVLDGSPVSYHAAAAARARRGMVPRVPDEAPVSHHAAAAARARAVAWSPVFWMDLQSLITLQLLRARAVAWSGGHRARYPSAAPKNQQKWPKMEK